ncbi:hypothetical protein BC939DRAFT_251031 [Gamsiella multidivaricata]|uniref:uncharacterized protein n=1 Tax=Gamsiella multidivaricata TaxID=101098 RepID=UPI00221EA4A0|nr:uncharacterized protein BC939DRAFT_251031 [Gamsiella multidivaricata]KAI7819708.1 hypothetical protein BC939DRAFT_251031 [Gamsiella multidivaricata]
MNEGHAHTHTHTQTNRLLSRYTPAQEPPLPYRDSNVAHKASQIRTDRRRQEEIRRGVSEKSTYIV